MSRRTAIMLALISSCAFATVAEAASRTLQIIVSKESQSLAVYDGETVVATSKVSTGKEGHDTPTGIFSILEKQKYHRSNIYSNSPMPWMQRLTWSGIALHESNSVPHYPASHGCVRLPGEFARSLYGMTDRGVHVIISDEAVQPTVIHHPTLFQPDGGRPSPDLLSDVPLRPSSVNASSAPVQVAMHVPRPEISTSPAGAQTLAPEQAPLRILITRRTEQDAIADMQSMLTQLGFDAGTPDGVLGTTTRSAIAAYKRWKNLSAKGPLISKEFVVALYNSADRAMPPAGQLLVRQGFKQILSEPIEIRQPAVALGTHFFSLAELDRTSGKAEWQGLTLRNDISESTRNRLGITQDAVTGPDAAKAALDRISVPEQLRETIGKMLSSGSSITITDEGVGPDTGEGTDFITITHKRVRS